MMRVLLVPLLVMALGSALEGLETRTYGPAELAGWTYPKGLVVVRPEGTVVRRFGKAYNAVSDMTEYSASVIGEHGTSKLRTPSNPDQVGRMADQDPGTWWSPDPADPLDRWWVELDLGRIVAATKIRVVFPDTAGAHPFAFFSVYSSPGVPLKASEKQIYFTRVGRPVNNNTQGVVEFGLNTIDQAVTTGQYLVTKDTLDFDLIRFVRFEATGRTKDAALAEIEVETLGFNLALKVSYQARVDKGLEVWGGKAWTSDVGYSGNHKCAQCGKGTSPEGIIDGDLAGRYWAIESAGAPDWRTWGQWWGGDLGSVFRIDRMIWMPLVVGESPILYGFDWERQQPWNQFDFLVSDGAPSSTADPDVEGPYQYDLLSSVNNANAPKRFMFDFQFPSRPVRFVFWRNMALNSGSWGRAAQLLLYHSEGYPEQVMLESPDMDLGGAYSIRRVEWDADLPAGTHVEVETQTGNGYQEVTRYFLSNGQEVSKEAYDQAKARQRGDIVKDLVRDPTWSSWSLPQRFSGQEFLSPTPRRWIRARVRLMSDDPEAMPSLRSLSFVMNTPVIGGGVTGRIGPSEAALDSLQEFRYLLRPNQPGRNDLGFDQVLIVVPPEAAAETELVAARVGGRVVDASGRVRGDSLVVQLPAPAVKSDSVEIVFKSRVFQSPTVFEAFVLNSAQAENTQGVVPAALGANQVYVAQAVEAESFFQNLLLRGVFTPNGDGANDVCEISFDVVKTARAPSMRILALDGALVRGLPTPAVTTGRVRYTWDGRNAAGDLVPPGVYIARFHITTDARDETVYRLIHVVY